MLLISFHNSQILNHAISPINYDKSMIRLERSNRISHLSNINIIKKIKNDSSLPKDCQYIKYDISILNNNLIYRLPYSE